MRRSSILALAGMLLSGACAGSGTTTPPVVTPPYPVGLTDQSLVSGGVTRDFRVHVPAAVAGGSTPRALVLVLHGGGGAGLTVANTGAHPLSVFRTVADREGVVVVYPGGLPSRNGDVGWNDCRSDNPNGSTADDVTFLVDLIERVRSAYRLPTSRVFMAGGSNGGLMTFAFLQHRADLVAAAATSAANLPRNPKPGSCSGVPSRRVPILLSHGTADPAMPFDGGCMANVGGGCSRGRVVSADSTRAFWLEHNGLRGVMPVATVVEQTPGDGGPANRFAYAGTDPVDWWRLDGGGHPVPSRTVLSPTTEDAGVQNRDVEFAEMAWAFFAARLP